MPSEVDLQSLSVVCRACDSAFPNPLGRPFSTNLAHMCFMSETLDLDEGAQFGALGLTSAMLLKHFNREGSHFRCFRATFYRLRCHLALASRALWQRLRAR